MPIPTKILALTIAAVAISLSAGCAHHRPYDRDNNPPGLAGGPGTNWENPPGPRGGPGASPNYRPWRW